MGGLREHKAELVELREQLDADTGDGREGRGASARPRRRRSRTCSRSARRSWTAPAPSSSRLLQAEKEREAAAEAAAAAASPASARPPPAAASSGRNAPSAAPAARRGHPVGPASQRQRQRRRRQPWPSSTWASPTSGAAPRPAASTAAGSPPTSTRRSARASPTTPAPLGRLPQGALRSAAAGRPGLLPRPGPHGDLHRRRPVRPRAAHRRRRQGERPGAPTRATSEPSAPDRRVAASRGGAPQADKEGMARRLPMPRGVSWPGRCSPPPSSRS